MREKGYIVTASIRHAKQIKCNEIWQITRSDKTIPGAIWVPELAPSWSLFNEFNHNWKDKSPEEWWPIYAKRFNEELRSQEKLQALRKLSTQVQQGKIIALVCFCTGSASCHRRLVAEFLEKQGIHTEEFIVPPPGPEEHVIQPALF
ncbi:MAG TPA: DUF488 domain-containing protein [Syntrophomonadaceae bacterium]|nr:DUF488 domain-containing protein [Syntrophomonadaceae bacterium]HPU47904.1 DUF488 domain-containing protein [Syntrophomonadaceae bacterium]